MPPTRDVESARAEALRAAHVDEVVAIGLPGQHRLGRNRIFVARSSELLMVVPTKGPSSATVPVVIELGSAQPARCLERVGELEGQFTEGGDLLVDDAVGRAVGDESAGACSVDAG